MKQLLSSLDTAEVLRYLGYNKQKQTPLDPAMQQMLTECITDTCQIITPAYRYLRFPLVRGKDPLTQDEEGGILIDGVLSLPGKSIAKHLRGCHSVFVLCVTIGMGFDRKIREQMLLTPERGVIYNSCGTTAVEQVADVAQAEIAALMADANECITARFSPGYGDLPLSLQRELLPLLSAHKTLGISLTDSDLMIPEKSVSALIGVYHPGARDLPVETPTCGDRSCAHSADCSFAKKISPKE